MPGRPPRALFASDCSTLVTLKRMCCQMHYNVLLCGFWDPDFRIQRTILA
jgi:hypothetical protein